MASSSSSSPSPPSKLNLSSDAVVGIIFGTVTSILTLLMIYQAARIAADRLRVPMPRPNEEAGLPPSAQVSPNPDLHHGSSHTSPHHDQHISGSPPTPPERMPVAEIPHANSCHDPHPDWSCLPCIVCRSGGSRADNGNAAAKESAASAVAMAEDIQDQTEVSPAHQHTGSAYLHPQVCISCETLVPPCTNGE